MWLDLDGKHIYLINCQMEECGGLCLDDISLGEQETLKEAEVLVCAFPLLIDCPELQQTGINSVMDAIFSIRTIWFQARPGPKPTLKGISVLTHTS